MRTDFSDDKVFNDWRKKFFRDVEKSFFPRGKRVFLLRIRTASTAVAIVSKLRNLPTEAVRLHMKVYHNDREEYPELLAAYEREMILAKTSPKQFASGLYDFYKATAKRMQSHLDLFLGLTVFTEDHKFEGTDFTVFSAFMDLLLQQYEFLRNDPLDYNKLLAGVETDGETTIEVNDPFPASDYPFYVVQEELTAHPEKYQTNESRERLISSEFMKLGYNGIRTLEDYEGLGATSLIYINNIYSMAAFINEYTKDLLPSKPLVPRMNRLRAPGLKVDLEYLSKLLRRRHRTLPAAGVKITFTNSSFYEGLTIKEIYKYGDMYLLYSLSTKRGDICGRYNIRAGSFYTPLNNGREGGGTESNFKDLLDKLLTNIKGLVFWAYAGVTCDDDLVKPSNESYHVIIDDDNAVLEILSLGNKLRKAGTQTGSTRQLDLEKYENAERLLNGFIRKLPVGQKASENAIKLARDVGLELAPGETYVRPFTRHSWVLKEK